MEFWIIFGVMGLLAIPMIVFYLCFRTDTNRKICDSLIVFVLWVAIAGGIYAQNQANAKSCDNGHCECGCHCSIDENKDCHEEIEIEK